MALTEDIKANARVMHAQGETVERIADHYQVPVSQVRRAVKAKDDES